MKRIFGGIVILILVVFFVSLFPEDASAIPAFSRKYNTTCMTCHTLFPKLSALGEAFRLNGYKIPDGDELYVKDQPVSMGVEPYKKVFPQSIWPSDIPGMPPFSLRASGGVNVATGGPKSNHTDFNFPGEMDLLAAGAFGKDFSFFTHLGFDTEEGNTTTSVQAWLMWQDLFTGILGKNHLNIKAGNLGRHTIALPNSRNENNYTIEGYLYQDELKLATQPGFQVNGFGSRWRYYAGIVQTNSDSSAKDYFGALAFKIGGMGFDGSGAKSEEGGLTTSPSGYWRDDSILFGLFGYRAFTGANADKADRFGGDLRVNFKDLSLGGGYIREKADVTDTTKNIWFVEGNYFVFPWLIPYTRYEVLTVDNTGDQDKSRVLLGTSFVLRANIKLNVEYRYYTNNKPREAAGGGTHDDDRLAFLLDFTF
ncbi:MAG: hypothetical protein HY787_24970 [Deltaproteobacteria bacterium]|nr:hypothetical protein [Deltaproteobacteria bacterium]